MKGEKERPTCIKVYMFFMSVVLHLCIYIYIATVDILVIDTVAIASR